MKPTFFSAPNDSSYLWTMIILSIIIGFIILFGLLKLPNRSRRPLILFTTFLGGLFWVVYWLWPTPMTGTTPGPTASWLQSAVPVVTVISNVIAQILLGLGVYSIIHLHAGRIIKNHPDKKFSAVLLISMFSMVIVGYWDWITTLTSKQNGVIAMTKFQQFARDFLFDGLLQQMDAAVFSLVAFYIFSAAYRAFRIRSIESSVMLLTAMLVILSLMGAVEYASMFYIEKFTNHDPNNFFNNFQLVNLSEWVRSNIERPSIRALEFGLGIGGLAIALRIWLGLDKEGVSS